MTAIPFRPSPAPLAPVPNPGMITEDEEKLYRTLARDFWRPDRTFLEIGTWLGRSTQRICQGFEGRAPGAWRLHCYDRYLWHETHVPKARRGGWPEPVRELRSGDSFRDAFLTLMGPFRERISAYSGGLDEIRTVMHGVLTDRDQLGVMFVDASKGWNNLHLLRFAAPFLVHDGQASRVVFQDFFMWSAYRLHFLLMLTPALEPESYVEDGGAVVFRVGARLDASQPSFRQTPNGLSRAQIFGAWERLTRSIPEARLAKQALHVSLPLMLWHCGHHDDAFAEMRRVPLTEAGIERIRIRASANPELWIPPIRERVGPGQPSSSI